jgi:hypothetical protein
MIMSATKMTGDHCPPDCCPGWQKGPLPADTYMWGGVVPTDESTGDGFYFADFRGDTVVLYGVEPERVLQAHEVKYFNNCLGLPPKS